MSSKRDVTDKSVSPEGAEGAKAWAAAHESEGADATGARDGEYDEKRIEDLSTLYLYDEHRKNDRVEALFDAIENGDFAQARSLLMAGAPLGTIDKNGRFVTTALHKAAYHGQLAIARYLIQECKAQVDAQDKLGMSPLHKAAWQGQLEVCKYLVTDAGADIWSADHTGMTPVQVAQKFGHMTTAKYLTQCLLDNSNPENWTETMEDGGAYDKTHQFKSGHDLVGCRVSVNRKLPGKGMFANKQWCTGTVIRYDENKVKHHVKFDGEFGGDLSWVHFEFASKPNKYRLHRLVPLPQAMALAEPPMRGKEGEGAEAASVVVTDGTDLPTAKAEKL